MKVCRSAEPYSIWYHTSLQNPHLGHASLFPFWALGRARFPNGTSRMLFMTVIPHATKQATDSTVDAANHPAHMFRQFQFGLSTGSRSLRLQVGACPALSLASSFCVMSSEFGQSVQRRHCQRNVIASTTVFNWCNIVTLSFGGLSAAEPPGHNLLAR